MKRDKYDITFSEIVRLRDNYTCQECGRYFHEGERGGLDCSHFVGRARLSGRYNIHNATSHCRGCHQKLGSNPILFTERIKKILGDKFDFMKRATNEVIKLDRTEKDAIRKHYMNEIKRLTELRKQGVMGVIEVTVPLLLDLKLREAVARNG
jgi:hypothetical protein|tara:strand:+ start:531 stop:986 length:456 start_codon:yes stop_codon:yes gene_type:complete